MSIIHVYLTHSQVHQLRQQDRDYLERKIKDHSMLNQLLNRPVNRPLLAELRCVLDKKPIPRRKIEQRVLNSKVSVYDAKTGKLIRIEHANGRVMKEIA